MKQVNSALEANSVAKLARQSGKYILIEISCLHHRTVDFYSKINSVHPGPRPPGPISGVERRFIFLTQSAEEAAAPKQMLN